MRAETAMILFQVAENAGEQAISKVDWLKLSNSDEL